MFTRTKHKRKGSNPNISATTAARIPPWIACTFGTVALLFLLFWESKSSHPQAGPGGVKTLEYSMSLQDGNLTMGDNKDVVVPFYSCGPTTDPRIQWILLHGARFTREDWKTSSIQRYLCESTPAGGGVSAISLDLPSQRTRDNLVEALDALELSPRTKVFLVTPSASGGTVADWLQHDFQDFASRVHNWIPVAPPAVSTIKETTLESVKGHVRIHAVYGSDDKMGKQVSEKLHEHAGASIEEIPGGHPCYLDSPNDFVASMRRLMVSENSDSGRRKL